MISIIAGRWRILKTGIRLHGISVVDDIWFTCCALHHMLLHVDGLDEKWNKGVKSMFEGELGWHAPGDVENYCAPLIFRRVNTGRQSGDLRQYDCSAVGYNAENIHQRYAHAEQENAPPSSSKKYKLLSITNKRFRDLLVINFMRRWSLKDVKWPSRTGRMAE